MRFARPGQYSPEDAKKAAEDAEFYSLVRSPRVIVPCPVPALCEKRPAARVIRVW